MSPEMRSALEELITAAEDLFKATSPGNSGWTFDLQVARMRYQKARDVMNRLTFERKPG